MKTSLPQRLTALFAAFALALGVGLITAGPASAEQADKYVVTNVPDRSSAPPGNIAIKNCIMCGEYNIAPGAYVVTSDTATNRPTIVMAENWYGIREEVRIAVNTDPNNRSWNTVRTFTYGCTASRNPYVMRGIEYLSNRSNSVESRLTVIACA